MSDDLSRLEDWAAPLLQQLQPAERRQLAKTLAIALRRSQHQRIGKQQNPDGSPYNARRLNQRRGRIKRKPMFLKLRQAKHLKAKADNNAASVGFFGRVANIARVHQYGLSSPVMQGGPSFNYQRRELLGFSYNDVQLIQSILLEHLTTD